MENTAFYFALLRYLPRIETEEFANVGVVLMSPKTRHFSFCLLEQPTERILVFFGIQNTRGLATGLYHYRLELDRVKAHAETLETSRWSGIFEELIRPREAVFRFSQCRYLLAAEPKTALDKLSRSYVEPQTNAPLAP
jgi:Protein of unknown function (DUF3037)